ncbi:MAG: NAD-dependent epimerase/dehydratase family protein [Acidimicrobiia bacterium]|nr:NAD-dependent epimerase/dehydratase family protein [Acidimicrobiia bacterium]
MHYFLTGASGFIGGYLTSLLLAEGHLVTALVRTPEQARALARHGVRPYIGDILDKESVRRAMRRAEGVFHLAAYVRVGITDRRRAEAVNVTGTRHVLEVMRDFRVPRGVYTSSLAVNGHTHGRVVDESYHRHGRLPSAYQRTKWQAHFEVALPMIHRGLPLVIAMPGAVYGPGDRGDAARAIGAHLRGRLPVAPTRTAFCWAYVEDVAAGLLRAMEQGKPGETYILGGPVHPLQEVLSQAGRLAGRRHPPLPLPWWLLKPAAWGMQGLAFALPPLRASAERLALGAGTTQLGSDARARADLGFAPRSLEAGLPDTVRSLLQDLFSAS